MKHSHFEHLRWCIYSGLTGFLIKNLSQMFLHSFPTSTVKYGTIYTFLFFRNINIWCSFIAPLIILLRYHILASASSLSIMYISYLHINLLYYIVYFSILNSGLTHFIYINSYKMAVIILVNLVSLFGFF
jgi:hypothetical protein